jgi:hypothetical protein
MMRFDSHHHHEETTYYCDEDPGPIPRPSSHNLTCPIAMFNAGVQPAINQPQSPVSRSYIRGSWLADAIQQRKNSGLQKLHSELGRVSPDTTMETSSTPSLDSINALPNDDVERYHKNDCKSLPKNHQRHPLPRCEMDDDDNNEQDFAHKVRMGHLHHSDSESYASDEISLNENATSVDSLTDFDEAIIRKKDTAFVVNDQEPVYSEQFESTSETIFQNKQHCGQASNRECNQRIEKVDEKKEHSKRSRRKNKTKKTRHCEDGNSCDSDQDIQCCEGEEVGDNDDLLANLVNMIGMDTDAICGTSTNQTQHVRNNANDRSRSHKRNATPRSIRVPRSSSYSHQKRTNQTTRGLPSNTSNFESTLPVSGKESLYKDTFMGGLSVPSVEDVVEFFVGVTHYEQPLTECAPVQSDKRIDQLTEMQSIKRSVHFADKLHDPNEESCNRQ